MIEYNPDQKNVSNKNDILRANRLPNRKTDSAGIIFAKSLVAYDYSAKANLLYDAGDLISSGTWHKYEQRVAALARSHPTENPFRAFLSTDSVAGWQSANTRQAYRSALVRIAARAIQELIAVYWKEALGEARKGPERTDIIQQLVGRVDAAKMAQMRAADHRLTPADRSLLARSIEFLNRVPPDPLHKAVRAKSLKRSSGAGRTTSTAKRALRALTRHERAKIKKSPRYSWRDHFWKTVLADPNITEKQCAVIATFMLTGCRPAELSERLGVTILTTDQGGEAALTFTVAGAKTSEEKCPEISGKGQVSRTIKLAANSNEAVWLCDYIMRSGQIRLDLSLPTRPRTPTGVWLSIAERERRLTVSLGKLITRIGKRAFPEQRNNLTPYVFRHALAADLKSDANFDPEVIAAFLGHQSTRTARHYGGSNRGRRMTSVRSQQISEVYGSDLIRSYRAGIGFDLQVKLAGAG